MMKFYRGYNANSKYEGFQSSNNSVESSNIDARLLKYFEDSLQKEIPISLSPSGEPTDKSNNEINKSSNVHETVNNERIISKLSAISGFDKSAKSEQNNPFEKWEEEIKDKSSLEESPWYSISKSNTYEEFDSNLTSNK